MAASARGAHGDELSDAGPASVVAPPSQERTSGATGSAAA